MENRTERQIKLNCPLSETFYFAFEIKFVHSTITPFAHSAVEAAHYHRGRDRNARRQCQRWITVLGFLAEAGLHLAVYPAPR